MDGFDSSEYSWQFVTASGKLDDGPCELVYANLLPSGASTGTILYAGKDAGGKEIIALAGTTVDNKEFSPAVPVYCAEGLYITIGSAVTGVLVIWHNL
jgi:hypothetical protein